MVSKEDKVAVLTSSGIDSLALLAYFSRNAGRVFPLYIACGFRWEESELFHLKKFLRALKVQNIEPLTMLASPLKDIYGSHWSVTGVKVPAAKSKPNDLFLPARNVFLLSKGALFCGVNQIGYLGIGLGRGYPFEDGKFNFLRQCESVFSISNRAEIKIETPFIEKSRDEILHQARDFGLEYSFSCLAPKAHQHCGECFKCNERRRAFAKSGIKDKAVYYNRHALST